LDQRQQISRVCDQCCECVQGEIDAADRELATIAATDLAARERAVDFWREQTPSIALGISQLGSYLPQSRPSACCGDGIQTISASIPSEGLCAQQLEEALKKALGDRACFLTFECDWRCEFEDGELVEFAIDCSYDPQPERRPGCCVPSQRTADSQGTQPDPGQSGEAVCHPSEEDAAEKNPDGWFVEAHDESGDLVGTSPIRTCGDGEAGESTSLDPKPHSVVGCACSVSAAVDGIPVTPGGPALAMQRGVQAGIAVTGSCGPDCGLGTQSITVQPPADATAWLVNPFAVAPLPVIVAGPTTTYDFLVAGVHEITARQLCEDGQECASTFDVHVAEAPDHVPADPADGGVSVGCPVCGSDECLVLSFQYHGEPPLIPLLGRWLALSALDVLDFEVSSFCRADCTGERRVAWEVCTPRGERLVFEDIDLYRISYAFKDVGQYSLCVVETVRCPEGDLRFENWWKFRVEPQAEDESLAGASPSSEDAASGGPILFDPGTGCPCSLSATVDGISLDPNDGLAVTAQRGFPISVAAEWDCGADCTLTTQSISIQPPALPTAPAWQAASVASLPSPTVVAGPSATFDLSVEGIHQISLQCSCGNDQSCAYTFDLHVAGPPDPVTAAPSIGGAATAQACPVCGSDDCINLAYHRIGDPLLIPVVDHWLTLTPPGVVNLQASSSCRTDCADNRRVAWEICTPRGEWVVFEDVDLYRISFAFKHVGQYSLCVVETVPCPEGVLRFENWWIIRVE